MRNYTLRVENQYGILGTSKNFSNDRQNQLKERGYIYEELFRMYKKTVCPFIELVLDTSKEKLYFYMSRYFTPAELDIYVKDKKDIEKIKAEVKWLRDNGYFIQKR